MKHQISFAESEFFRKKKVTRRERFLGEMERVVPWARLEALVKPYYPSGKRGRPPIGIERMLRIYFLQQWYNLADEALEDAIYDSQALRSFAGINLSVESVPDATTLLHFRHLLEENDLTKGILGEVNALLSERHLFDFPLKGFSSTSFPDEGIVFGSGETKLLEFESNMTDYDELQAAGHLFVLHKDYDDWYEKLNALPARDVIYKQK